MEGWKEIANKKQNEVLSSIPREWIVPGLSQQMVDAGFTNSKLYIDTLVAPEELEITNLTVSELSIEIAAGKLSSWDVCNAFCHRAALAHQLLNCCVEIFFDRALKKAREQDEFFAKHKKTIGPLHGIPISLKDQVNLPGIDTTIGYVGYVGKRATKESLLASILEQKGALFYVKTTVPTAMMAPETISNLMGMTLNGFNINFSSGGSSGGEAALIAARGSPLGVGTDIGGSIRIPACFQGLYGLRPSHGRIPYMDVANSYVGQEVVPSVIGPLGTSLEDLELFAKLVVDSPTSQLDPKVVPIPWRDMSHLRKEKLRFAVMRWDGQVMVHPPVNRAFQTVLKALQEAGHEVVDYNFQNHKEVLSVADRVFSADHGKEIQGVCDLTGEPMVECVRSLVRYEPGAAPMSLQEWWAIAEQKSRLREEFLDYWKSTAEQFPDKKPIDAVLCPVWPTAGFKKCDGSYAAGNYTAPFNVIDCASVVIPVTFVDKEVDLPAQGYVPVDDFDKKIHDYYDQNEFHGMPVCIQVVCRKFEEEKALAIASMTKDLLG